MSGRVRQLLAFNIVLLVGALGLAVAQITKRLPDPPPIGGTAGLFMIPAELSPGAWGCYLLDADSRTLATYRYDASERPAKLRLHSSRGFGWDRRLSQFNTHPLPADIARLNRLIDESRRMNQ